MSLAATAASSQSYTVDGLIYEPIQGERYGASLVSYVAGTLPENLELPQEIITSNGSFFMIYRVGEGALRNAPVKTLVLPAKCTEVGARAVEGCTQLDSLVFQTQVNKIGAHLTDGCKSLKVVNLLRYGSSVDLGTAADSVFTMSDYTLYLGRNIEFSGTAEQSPFAGDGLKRVVYCPEVGSGEGVFAASTGLKVVEVERSIYTVHKGAFRGAPALEKVLFNNQLGVIGDYAFADCPSLKTISIPENVETIGNGAFSGMKMDTISCAALTPPTLADDAFSDETFAGAVLIVSTDALDAYKAADGWKKFANIKTDNSAVAFVVNGVKYTPRTADEVAVSGYDAAAIPSALELPATVKNDGVEYAVTSAVGGALKGAPVKSVRFSPSMTVLPGSLLDECPQLDSIVVPASVTRIEPCMNYDCEAMKAVVIEPGDAELDLGDPNDMALFGRFTLYLGRPVKVPEFHGSPFTPFRNNVIKAVLYPEVGECNGLFFRSQRITSAEFVEGYTVIPAYICSEASALTDVKIPSTVTVIGDEAFIHCSALKEVTLPAAITSIGADAFNGTTVLSTVTSMSTLPAEIKDTTFSNDTYSGAQLFVPKGTAQYYAAADGWKKFKNIIEKDFSGVTEIEKDDAAEGASVTVVDLQGRGVYAGSRAGMPALAPGIYVMRTGEKVRKIYVK